MRVFKENKMYTTKLELRKAFLGVSTSISRAD